MNERSKALISGRQSAPLYKRVNNVLAIKERKIARQLQEKEQNEEKLVQELDAKRQSKN